MQRGSSAHSPAFLFAHDWDMLVVYSCIVCSALTSCYTQLMKCDAKCPIQQAGIRSSKTASKKFRQLWAAKHNTIMGSCQLQGSNGPPW